MRKVQLYIENQLVDLFEDEEIKVDSSIQDVNDIAKVFTDYSQTFTVPASVNNNKIFDFYYNNDVDGTYQAQTRVAARLEINHAKFREGKIQLEGAEIKNNNPESYKVTFYGDVVSLKDLFSDDKLSDLDYSGLSHEYTGANVQTGITSTSDIDVRYPLISSSRVWSYGDAAATDISVSGNAIDYTELFPALKDDVILDAIEAKYGVTFTAAFRTNGRFLKSFTWWKNRTTTNFTNTKQDVLFTGSAPIGTNVITTPEYINSDLVPNASWIVVPTISHVSQYIQLQYNPSFSGEFTVHKYKNGIHVGQQSYANTFGTSGLIGLIGYASNFAMDDDWSFKISTQQSGTMTGTIKHIVNWTESDIITGGTKTNTQSTTTTANISTITFDNYIDFNSSAPDIKVADWFSGLLKQFNLTCYPLDDDLTYQLEPLEDWYSAGGTVDITPYVDTDSIKIDRLSLHKEINFEWEKSKAFLNEAYEEINGKRYGDLKNTFPYDGSKYEVKLPFENLLFQNFSGQSGSEALQVSYCLDAAPNYKPYVPKPVKLYLHEDTACDFYLDNGSATQITSYVPMGQDGYYNADNYSINWGDEQSSLLGVGVSNSLYQIYYSPMLQNLFSPKSRKVSLSCILPLPMLTALTLDDKVIVRDKAYRINNMKTNLSTGVVDLVLISDWIKDRGALPPSPPIPATGATIVLPVRPSKPELGGSVWINSLIGSKFVSYTGTPPFKYYTDSELEITIPANTTGLARTNTFEIVYYYPDGTVEKTLYFPVYQEADVEYLLTESSSYILTESLDRIILE